MRQNKILRYVLTLILLALFIPAGFNTTHAQDEVTITLAGFAVPREAYGELIPLFQKWYEEETGVKVTVETSFEGSGSQSRAIIGGFEADVAALSIESHITAIEEAGLITHEWKTEYGGSISNSVVVLAVRPGNPEGIKDWADIAEDGIEVITPDPATSGGAQWNLLAAYGAARRGFVEGYEEGEEGGIEFLSEVIDNVLVFDKDGRESYLTFENGIGDVAITYENEIFAARQAGNEVDVVYPTSTILIQNPIAVIDEYVDMHGTREAAEAFVAFLRTPEAQRIYASHGFRPILEEVAAEEEIAEQFPEIEDVFTIEEFDGWDTVAVDLFGTDGQITLLIAEIKGQ